MWSGWRKNFYEGARRNPLIAIFFILALVGILVVPMPALLWLAIRRLREPLTQAQCRLATCSATLIGSTVIIRLLRDKAIGFKTDVVSVAATPLAGLFAACVMAASAWRVLSGLGQVWKGRTIV
jgi:glucan phosphoethanolaminetransferase (alkaline phosphatase superfamily)